MKAFRNKGLRAAAIVGAGLIAGIVALDVILPPLVHRGEALSPLVLDRNGEWLHAFATPEGRWRFGADLDSIDPVFVERLVAIEDKRFWKHGGVDPLAVFRAGRSALQNAAVTSGASTITMQTARLLEPRPRTIGSKLIEMVRAAQIERRLSKREILELYLTLAPYGGNIEGVRAASLSYFGKEPERLTDGEQALLIALPQAPEARRPDRRPAAAKAARRVILARLVEAKLVSASRAAEAADASLPAGRSEFPRAAFHLAGSLAKQDEQPIVRSTVDLAMQREAETIVAAAAARASDGATAAAIIIDNKTRAVRALVGSSGLSADGGWIDLTTASRSPGSTLKPFIYGLAFDDGLVGPGTLIEDMPQSFDGYAPENFDRVFRGDVRVADALQHSLNVPAVSLLNRLGAPRLLAMLKAAGVAVSSPHRADGGPGLTLALGGAGVTMRDLAALYAGLAEGGLVRPLAYLFPDESEAPASEAEAFRLISAESARSVSLILSAAPALEGRAPAALSVHGPKIALKTGTSYGYRDAWAAGHAGGYTVVAWVGRADGASRPGVTGRDAAAPLLVDLFDMIWRSDPAAGEGVREIEEPQSMAVAAFAPAARASAPEIVFPTDGVELFAEAFEDGARGFSLAARGGSGGYRWYVAGDAVAADGPGGRAVWRPSGPGFYEIIVVDRHGKSDRAKVRVAAEG